MSMAATPACSSAPHSFGAGIDFLEVVEQVEAWGVDSLFVAPGTGPFGLLAAVFDLCVVACPPRLRLGPGT